MAELIMLSLTQNYFLNKNKLSWFLDTVAAPSLYVVLGIYTITMNSNGLYTVSSSSVSIMLLSVEPLLLLDTYYCLHLSPLVLSLFLLPGQLTCMFNFAEHSLLLLSLLFTHGRNKCTQHNIAWLAIAFLKCDWLTYTNSYDFIVISKGSN